MKKNLAYYKKNYGVESEENSDFLTFEILADSKYKLSARDVKEGLRKCVLRRCKNQFKEGSTTLKLLLVFKFKADPKPWNIWAKVDSVSYKEYAENQDANIDPKQICLYELHDPTHQYGSPEKDYTWAAVRINHNAITSKPAGDDMDEFFERTPEKEEEAPVNQGRTVKPLPRSRRSSGKTGDDKIPY